VALGRGFGSPEQSGAVVRDPAFPDQLFVAPSRYHPPALWIAAEANRESLLAALAPYFLGKAVPDEALLDGQVRLFLGTPGALEVDGAALAQRFALSAFCESLQWGSSCSHDPYGGAGFDMTLDAFKALQREALRQVPGRVPSTSFRTLHSKSVVRIEEHGDFFVAEVRYRRLSPNARLAAVNHACGTSFPLDLPVDAAAALVGLPAADSARLLAAVAPGEKAFALHAAGVVGGEGLADALERYAADPEVGVRRQVATVARWHRAMPLLRDMAERESDPRLKSELTAALVGDRRTPPPLAPVEPVRLLVPVNTRREQIESLAGAEHWLPLARIEKLGGRPFEIQWSTPDNKTFVHYVEDELLGRAYLVLRGMHALTLSARLRQLLPFESRAEAERRARESELAHEQVDAIRAAAAAAPPTFDLSTFHVVVRALASKDATVRLAGILAVGYAPWREFERMLRAMEDRDEDPEVRRSARKMRKALPHVAAVSLMEESGPQLQ
jgi:hypothetical protein